MYVYDYFVAHSVWRDICFTTLHNVYTTDMATNYILILI